MLATLFGDLHTILLTSFPQGGTSTHKRVEAVAVQLGICLDSFNIIDRLGQPTGKVITEILPPFAQHHSSNSFIKLFAFALTVAHVSQEPALEQRQMHLHHMEKI